MFRAIFLLTLLFVSGCATLETHSKSIRTNERTFVVTGFHSDYSTARELALLRAAQETLAAGYRYFEITRERENENKNLDTSGGYYVTREDKDGNEYQDYVPPRSSTTTVFTRELTIKVYLTEADADHFGRSASLNDAKRIYDRLAPRWVQSYGANTNANAPITGY